jgi:hypothetical protein
MKVSKLSSYCTCLEGVESVQNKRFGMRTRKEHGSRLMEGCHADSCESIMHLVWQHLRYL